MSFGGVDRRTFLGLGAGTIAVLAASGATWRAVDQGVFATATGQAYAAWDEWNPPGDDVQNLVRAAVLAASAHNTQPWLFLVTPDRIDLYADPARNIGTMDPLRREMHISLGCALENLVLAAAPNGKAPAVTLMPDPADKTHMARIELRATPATTSALFEAIPNRHTNRAAYDTAALVSRNTLAAMTDLIDAPDTDVIWFTSTHDKRGFGDLVVRATRAIIGDPRQAGDSAAWYRADWNEIQTNKDGVTADPSVPSPLTRTLLKMLPPQSPKQNDDYWLAATQDTHVPTASAFGTLVVRDPVDPGQRLNAGRTWQRMHLWATTQGLAVHPLNQVEERVDREHTAGLAPEFTNAMAGLLPAGRHAIFSFRIGHPTTGALRSPRRSAEEVQRPERQ